MKTPIKNQDLRHVDTELTASERTAALTECKLMKAKRNLGTYWLLHPNYSGHYQPELHARTAR